MMNTNEKLAELTLEELIQKRKKINQRTLMIQIPLLIIAVGLLILNLVYKQINILFVVFISTAVTFIPLFTGIATINAEINKRKKMNQ